MFEGEEIFDEEDGTVRGKGRKKTRLSQRWTLTSRSPSPVGDELAEVEKEPSLEPKVHERPAMTDEGCQTVGLEVDDAAEALASFSRQAVNVGSTLYTEPGEGLKTNLSLQQPLSIENSVLLPAVQTSFTPDDQTNFEQEPPSSPQLLPQPSESLPLVSPLVSKSLFGFATPLQSATSFGQSGFEREHPSTSLGNSQSSVKAVNEDLYSASPKRTVEVSSTNVLSSRDPLFDADGLGSREAEKQFLSENQYGQWGGDTANLINASSPFEQSEHANETVGDEHFYVEENEGLRQPPRHGEPLHAEDRLPGQYLDLADLPGQHPIPVFGEHSTVAYPELPEPDDGLRDTPRAHTSAPQVAEMSRTQSQHSQAVDLTESSDEEDEERERATQENLPDAEDYDELEVADNVSPRLALDNQYDYDEDEESYDEDDIEEEDDEDNFKSYQNRDDFYEDEDGQSEGGYNEDEDMEDDMESARAPVQKEPVVIDLLSSDDEDADEVPIPKQHKPSIEVEAPETEPMDEELDSEEEGGSVQDDQSAAETEVKLPVDVTGERTVNEDSDESGQEVVEDEGLPAVSNSQDFDDEESSENEASASDRSSRHEDNDDLPGEEVAASHFIKQQILVDEKTSAKNSQIPQVEETAEDQIAATVYPQLFGNDGTNDENVEDTPYSRLSDGDKVFNGSEYQHSEHISQLPTPEDTQKTEKVMAPENPFSTTNTSQDSLNESTDLADTLGAKSQDFKVEITEPSTVPAEVDQDEVQSTKEAAAESASKPISTIGHKSETEEQVYENIIDKATEDALMDIAPTEEQVFDEIVEKATQDALLQETTSREEILEVGGAGTEQETIEKTIVEAKEDTSKEGTTDRGNWVTEVPQEEVTKEVLSHAFDDSMIEDAAIPGEKITQRPYDGLVVLKETIRDIPETVEGPALVSPRRSSRLVKSMNADANDSVRPSTPEKPTEDIQQASSRSDRSLPIVVIDEQRFSPEGHDASIELALALQDSPSRKRDHLPTSTVDTPHKQHNLRNAHHAEAPPLSGTHNLRRPARGNDAAPKQHDLRKQSAPDTASSSNHDFRKNTTSGVDLKLRLSRALRTLLSEFTALKVLRYHLNHKLEVLAVATTSSSDPQRGRGGLRQFLTTFNITDVTIAPSAVTEVQVYRPYKEALPIVKSGDGVLLRDFQVISAKNRGFALRSEETSSWAVFRGEEEPEVRGPPVELGDEEEKHVALLRQWYGDLDEVAMAKIDKANEAKGSSA